MNKPLEEYRTEELVIMKVNFYENNMNYNEKRYNFVHKIQNESSDNIADLYKSRRTIYRKRKWENIQYKDKNEQ
jgi:hypothetical protein